MLKTILIAVVAALLLAAGGIAAVAASITTEEIAIPYTVRVTDTHKGKGQVYTVVGTARTTDTDTVPDPVTVTVTVTQETTTTTPPTTTTTPPTTTTTPPPSGAISPGQSWQAAYDAAAPGATLTVLAGNHGRQTLTGTKAVTFLGDEGAVARQLQMNASNITVQNVDADQGNEHSHYHADNAANIAGNNVTFRDVNLYGSFITVNLTGSGFTWQRGSFGRDGTVGGLRTCLEGDNVGVWIDGDNATFDSIRFNPQDADPTPRTCQPTNGFHYEDLRLQEANGLTVKNSRFVDASGVPGNGNGSGSIFITSSSAGRTISGLVLENNQFERVHGSFNIQIHSNVSTYSNWTIKNNNFTQGILDPGTYQNLVACGNVGAVPASWQTACGSSPSPGGSLAVSPTGNDAGSCTTIAPCRTFARAAEVALTGSTIEVLAGTHGVQKFAGGYGSTQGAINKTLTFHGQAGNKVRQINFSSGNFTFDGINIDNSGGAKLTGAGLENGGAPMTFKNGSIGNIVDEKGALVTEGGIVFDNVLFHDVNIATPGVHLECIFAAVPEGMIIRDSEFVNCDVMDVFFVWPDWWSPQPPSYGNVVLERNSFGDPNGSCCGIYVGGTGPSGDRTMRNWTVRNNFFGDSPAIAGQSGGTYCGNTGAAPSAWQTPCGAAAAALKMFN